MDHEAILRRLFAAVLLIHLGMRGLFQFGKAPGDRLRTSARQARWSLVLPAATGLVWFGTILLWGFGSEIVSGGDLPIPLGLRWGGIALAAATLPLYLWVHRALGTAFSTALLVREGQSLVTAGPYRWVRHPMYSIGFLLLGAAGLLTANAYVSAAGLLFAVAVGTRVGREERMLREVFGAAYAAYAREAGRFLPRFPRR